MARHAVDRPALRQPRRRPRLDGARPAALRAGPPRRRAALRGDARNAPDRQQAAGGPARPRAGIRRRRAPATAFAGTTAPFPGPTAPSTSTATHWSSCRVRFTRAYGAFDIDRNALVVVPGNGTELARLSARPANCGPALPCLWRRGSRALPESTDPGPCPGAGWLGLRGARPSGDPALAAAFAGRLRLKGRRFYAIPPSRGPHHRSASGIVRVAPAGWSREGIPRETGRRCLRDHACSVRETKASGNYREA